MTEIDSLRNMPPEQLPDIVPDVDPMILTALEDLKHSPEWKEVTRCGFCAEIIRQDHTRFRLGGIQKDLEICPPCRNRYLRKENWQRRGEIRYVNGAVEICISPLPENSE